MLFTRLGETLLHKLTFVVLGITSLWTVQRILRRIGPLPESLRQLRVWPRNIKGLSVCLDPTDISHIIIFKEIFVDKIYDLDGVPFVPDLIVDCGGHIGLFSLLARQRFPSVSAMVFEPNVANLHYLHSQVEDNKLDVNIVPAAVSNFDGEAQFHAGCSCSGGIQTNSNSPLNVDKVKVVNLCRLLSELRPKLLILKMDIEGGEEVLLPEILPLLPQKAAIFFETHDGDASWVKHSRNLQNAGFIVSQTSNRDRYCDGFALRV
ncbi:FkbM family methyltransferase [Prosthecobacter vanneervenii]|uniref:FkbM family methyltransferase n=1 Tax=Prosthecobacter vanneervenii TaxID=48466 RepID=A0A7W7Y7E0_9BACT|nr:FkbM family methyltransferase [Prosthecobacter vanneervenii]MBB5030973.1 FkbM family methyltransferase [Prosthecobacter vanneervenii]